MLRCKSMVGMVGIEWREEVFRMIQKDCKYLRIVTQESLYTPQIHNHLLSLDPSQQPINSPTFSIMKLYVEPLETPTLAFTNCGFLNPDDFATLAVEGGCDPASLPAAIAIKFGRAVFVCR